MRITASGEFAESLLLCARGNPPRFVLDGKCSRYPRFARHVRHERWARDVQLGV